MLLWEWREPLDFFDHCFFSSSVCANFHIELDFTFIFTDTGIHWTVSIILFLTLDEIWGKADSSRLFIKIITYTYFWSFVEENETENVIHFTGSDLIWTIFGEKKRSKKVPVRRSLNRENKIARKYLNIRMPLPLNPHTHTRLTKAGSWVRMKKKCTIRNTERSEAEKIEYFIHV